jgi:hypothetical protein
MLPGVGKIKGQQEAAGLDAPTGQVIESVLRHQ